MARLTQDQSPACSACKVYLKLLTLNEEGCVSDNNPVKHTLNVGFSCPEHPLNPISARTRMNWVFMDDLRSCWWVQSVLRLIRNRRQECTTGIFQTSKSYQHPNLTNFHIGGKSQQSQTVNLLIKSCGGFEFFFELSTWKGMSVIVAFVHNSCSR